ncbi:agmatine deiminase family protein [Methanothrix sp.]|uniref:agmatine deiminase family protein n=1 Tax=Methanothrix sp. TaxID=90426 RepID=UPI001BD61F41
MAAESKNERVTIGLIQSTISEDRELNLRKAIEMVREAAKKGAKIVCLPELYRTRYFPQWDEMDASSLAESIPGQSTEAFSALARELGIVIIIPIYEKTEDDYYNSAAVIDSDGSLLETYHKTHIPYDPLFYEQSYFSPGDEIRIYETRHARFAVLICYDQWFPEPARVAALGGAQIIFYPTAIGHIAGQGKPPEGDWHDAWETVQRGHAISNSICVAAVNRVGREESLCFWGGSFVADSFGNILAKASSEREEILLADLDLSKNQSVREGWGFFRNRRPDIYWPIIEMVKEAAPEKREGTGLERKPVKGEELCLVDTPQQLGFHMPAEWEEHEAIWLSWPYDQDTFLQIERVEEAYLAIIKAIHKSEIVNLLVRDDMMLSAVVERLREWNVDLRRIRFHEMDYADVWFRDYGPTFVVARGDGPAGDRIAMVAWTFNAWGEKYPGLMRDTKIPCLINDDLKMECFVPGIVLEGGSIDVNGLGTLLTTEQCLLNRNRNPGLGKEEIERYLQEYLGVRKIIWLKEGIAGDDTDGHVDDIARFVDPTTVLCAYEEDSDDDNYLPLKENYEQLSGETDQDGNPLKVIKLPMPSPVENDGGRLPASYANFYIGNDAVLVPQFRDENDQKALKIIQGLFPDRRAVGIDCRELVEGLGTIHCISQQQPRVK